MQLSCVNFSSFLTYGYFVENKRLAIVFLDKTEKSRKSRFFMERSLSYIFHIKNGHHAIFIHGKMFNVEFFEQFPVGIDVYEFL